MITKTLLFVAAGVMFVIAFSGCAGKVPPAAYVFKTEAAKVIEDVATRFDRIDDTEQERILKESPQNATMTNLKTYDDNVRKPFWTVVAGFRGTLGAYGAALNAAAQGMAADWLGLGFTLVKAGIELTETLKRLKVPINFTMPSFFGGK